MKTALGIDIGGTKCAVCIGQQSAEGLTVLEKATLPTRGTPEEMLQSLLEAARELIAAHGRPDCCGIVCGNPLDSKKGLICSPPNLPGWDDVPVVTFFQEALGINVHLLNDADAGALAEWQLGAGRGYQNMIFITFGTGCGAGLILNGHLYTGACNFSGECGHLRLAEHGPVGYGKAGSMEGFCSGGGIAQLGVTAAREQLQQGKSCSFCPTLADMESITAKDIALQAMAGDPLARQVYTISGEYLGKGLAVMIDLLNPECIVIGSIFTRSRELLWPAALKVLEKECLPAALAACEIKTAQLGEQIGDFAALAAALFV